MNVDTLVAPLALGLSLALCAGSEITHPVPIAAQVRGDPIDTAGLERRIDRVVAPYVAARDFMGVIGVQRPGRAPLVLPYGLASLELEVPHRASDVFMIGSVSKQFTAASILLLEEDGALTTSAPVERFLPDFPEGERITIEHLLTHTSGVPDIFSLEIFGETGGRGLSFEEVVEALGQTPLTHAPGSTYAYSSGGYAILAAVVEEVSGMSYGDFLQERILDPLTLAGTSHDSPGLAAKDRVPGYDPWGIDSLSPAESVSEAFTTGSGSLWSSARDLIAWTSALHGGRVLTEESYEKLSQDYGYGYGYGVSVFTRFGRSVIGHDGRIAGYAGDVAHDVDDATTVVVLSNVQSVARDEIRRGVAAAVLGERYDPPSRPDLVNRAPGPIRELEGTYSFGPGFLVSIGQIGDRLLARANQGVASELIPTAKGAWFSRMLYTSVRFERDERGRVDRLVWGSGGEAPVGLRSR